MSDLRKKLARTQRITKLENIRLTALVSDVVQIDAQLNACRAQVQEWISVRDQSFTNSDQLTVEMLSQNGVWMEGIDRTIAEIQEQIRTLLGEREQAQQRVLEQRARVKGLEKLLDSIRFDVESELATQQMLIADENALKDYAG